ncbi:MAG: NAD(P)-dependent alcohol dehydrogenase [Chloroflexi bacterium]|nr:NAD(P)-dependent alcohol dehydrogenase [Chloroflexota bacterium]
MQALVHDRFGSPDVLELREVDTPSLDDKSVLIRVCAASVNPLDWHMLTGRPLLMRVSAGVRRPRSRIRGADVAGRVEAVGATVTHVQPGDEVFGVGEATFAEYALVPGNAVVHMPKTLTHAQAACVPVAGLTALQALRDKGGLQAGQAVLINGAGGGVGTFAVQIARAMGAQVTGVCSTRNVELVHSLGAEHVIDYTRDDFTAAGKRYDLIVDNVGNHGFWALRRALTPAGRCVIVGGPKGNVLLGPLSSMVRKKLASRFVSQSFVPFFASPNRHDLQALAELVDSGAVTPVVDKIYALGEVPSALRQIAGGHTRGKLAVEIQRAPDREQ